MRRKTAPSVASFSKYDHTVPIVVRPHQITGTNDRNLIGNAFLSRLEHFGVRQDLSDAAKAMRATKVVDSAMGDATVGDVIDRSLATICDVIVDAFQALPPETWERVAVRIGCLAPCRAVPVALTDRSQTSTTQDVAGRAIDPVQLPRSEADALIVVLEILRMYDSMSMRACNTIRSHLGLSAVALEAEEEGADVAPMSRRERRLLNKLYLSATAGAERDIATMRDPNEARRKATREHGFVFISKSFVNHERFERQIARGRTIRILGIDSRPPASGKD